jgi:hypothetical protein
MNACQNLPNGNPTSVLPHKPCASRYTLDALFKWYKFFNCDQLFNLEQVKIRVAKKI